MIAMTMITMTIRTTTKVMVVVVVIIIRSFIVLEFPGKSRQENVP